MFGHSLAAAAAAALLVTALACAGPAKAELKAGDVAPAFELMGSDGKVHRLADDLGKKAVVVAWFPKAFTSG